MIAWDKLKTLNNLSEILKNLEAKTYVCMYKKLHMYLMFLYSREAAKSLDHKNSNFQFFIEFVLKFLSWELIYSKKNSSKPTQDNKLSCQTVLEFLSNICISNNFSIKNIIFLIKFQNVIRKCFNEYKFQ